MHGLVSLVLSAPVWARASRVTEGPGSGVTLVASVSPACSSVCLRRHLFSWVGSRRGTRWALFRGYLQLCPALSLYVCMYRGYPLWNCPLLRAVQLGQGEGPIRIVGPMSQPHGYHGSCVTHAGSYLYTWCAFCNQLYSRQLGVTCFLT